ncbi:MAG: PAS domain S-box protein [Candidatus Electryonea clarkiae]|nr:PAS domain S-box protein [Candidatus Electryonea clarkiae]
MSRTFHILLIDSEESHAEFMHSVFLKERDRFRIKIVQSLAESRKVIPEFLPDLIITDLFLPDGNCEELLHLNISTLPYPVIIMTTQENEEIAKKAVEKGALDYIIKSQDSMEDIIHIAERTFGEWNNIQERIRVEEELIHSERQYEQLAELAKDVILKFNMDGQISYINRAGLDVLGCSFEQALEQNVLDLIPDNQREAVQQRLKKRLDGDDSNQNYEVDIKHKSGKLTPFEISSSLIVERGKACGVLIVARDITKRKRNDAALKVSEGRFQRIIEQSNDAIYVIQNLRFVHANPKFLDLHEYTFEELASEDFDMMSILTPYSKRIVEDRMKKQERGEEVKRHYEFQAKSKSGKILYFTASISQIVWEGQPATLGMLRDATEVKRLEEQLIQAQKMEAVGQLASGIAHDFNNLLTAISGNVELSLMSLDQNDPLYDELDEVMNTVGRAADLTRQLLAFSRHQVLIPKVIDLNKTINNLKKMLNRIMGENVELVTFETKNLCRIKADPSQIEQVIVNLIVNARDAMPDGGKITIETENIELDEEYCEDYPYIVPGVHVMLSVTDNGQGMSEDIKQRIFEPFFTTKEEGRGTGLGLATVYGIVKQSGGHIHVYSEIGSGTTFKVYLPIEESEEEEITVKAEGFESLTGTEVVLLVEDDPAVRHMTSRSLTRFGYKVIEASNGGEAIILSNKAIDPIDLILTDLVMPHMTGTEVVKHVLQKFPDAKVLYMSGFTEKSIVRNVDTEKISAFLQKPFRPMILAEKLRELLDEV